MPDLHAVTLRQPLADDVAAGRVWLLPRPRRQQYTGRILIHSARYRLSHPSLGAEATPNQPGMAFGAIVGSAVLDAWVPVVAGYQPFWDAWQSGQAFIDSDSGVSRYWPAWTPRDPNRGWVDCTDQVPEPEGWAVTLTQPATTWDRCPVCWTDGEPCSLCDSAGSCPPIGDVRGFGGLWRWKPPTGCRR